MSYTFSCKTKGVFTWIDNIFIPVSLINNNEVHCDIIDDALNSSDHVAMLCHFINAVLPMGNAQVHSNVSKSYRKMYIWSESAKRSYYDATVARLQINCDSRNLFKCC